MIAPAANRVAPFLVDQYGDPLRSSRPSPKTRPEVVQVRRTRSPAEARAAEVHASYDAARDTDEFKNYWANADHLDADSANSKPVRKKLVSRSRYEAGSNGFVDGMYQTHANYLVRKGPKLRMKTISREFNTAVEAEFAKWSKATLWRRKLWCMAHAKIQDGEGFGLVQTNPKLRHPVKLDVCLIETEQCSTPQLPWGVKGYIDGVKFDEWGNPEHYDILPYHPGGQWRTMQYNQPDPVPAKFVLHWFTLRRPQQHRGVPELRSTLNVGAASRRWREATIAAAETAADLSILLRTQLNPNSDSDLDPLRPFTSLPIEKRTMMALAQGWEPFQMRAEHPGTDYRGFLRSQISEQSRPKSMPHNLAAADSSDHSYASGRLDFQPYYMGLDNEREDANELVLEPLFRLWWAEAKWRFGWIGDDEEPPPHAWDWGPHPPIDQLTDVQAKDSRLKDGLTSLSALYAEDGEDFEDALEVMAKDYGKTTDEMRQILCDAIFNVQGQQATMLQARGGASPTPSGGFPDGFGDRLAERLADNQANSEDSAAGADPGALAADYDPRQPRDDGGRWTESGRGGGSRGKANRNRSGASARYNRSARVATRSTTSLAGIGKMSADLHTVRSLNPTQLRSPLIVKRVGGRDYVVDGRRRAAGIMRWSLENRVNPSKIDIPVLVVHDDRLAADVSSRSKAVRTAALQEVYKAANEPEPRQSIGRRAVEKLKKIAGKAARGTASLAKDVYRQAIQTTVEDLATGRSSGFSKTFAKAATNASLDQARARVAKAVGVNLQKVERAVQRVDRVDSQQARAIERERSRDFNQQAREKAIAERRAAAEADRAQRKADSERRQADRKAASEQAKAEREASRQSKKSERLKTIAERNAAKKAASEARKQAIADRKAAAEAEKSARRTERLQGRLVRAKLLQDKLDKKRERAERIRREREERAAKKATKGVGDGKA
jgi:hypothetical protein